MSEIKGLYCYNNYCLIQMGEYSNRVRDKFKLNPASINNVRTLETFGWKRISSKHLAVWND